MNLDLSKWEIRLSPNLSMSQSVTWSDKEAKKVIDGFNLLGLYTSTGIIYCDRKTFAGVIARFDGSRSWVYYGNIKKLVKGVK